MAPASEYGISNQLLYVANGQASNVKVIDVGTMSIVDTIPVPNEVTPAFYHGLNTGLMNWEIHGVVPAADRQSIYAVGALSGGSYNRNPDGSIDTSSTAGDPLGHTPGFRLADYRMYDINTATKKLNRSIPLQGPGDPVNPVGYCGLEYNLNNESSNEIIATSMNAANSTLKTVLFGAWYQNTNPLGANYTTDPTLVGKPVPGSGVDLGFARGTGSNEHGGWSFTDIASGTHTGFMSTDFNGNNESSTCGIAWNAAGDRAWATQMFEVLTDKINWTTRTVDGQIAVSAPAMGNSYHQATSDKVKGLLYVAAENGYLDVYDMNTNLPVGSINVRALTGSSTNAIHAIDLAPGNSGVAYVTSRWTPDRAHNEELVLSIADYNAPVLIGAVDGLAESVCGVYADADKSKYYAAANKDGINNQMLFVANGQASNVKVIDVGTMSIVDTIPVPNEVTPAFYHGLNTGLMNWEIHGVVPAADRQSIYAVGALSGGSYNRNPDGSIDTSSTAGDPLGHTPGFRLADYRMYDINTATKKLNRSIPLQGPGDPVNPVGYCGLEYNLNNESSNEIIATSMNAANSTLKTVLFGAWYQNTNPLGANYTTDPTLVGKPVPGSGVDLGFARGTGSNEHGGWSFTDIASGTHTGFMSTDFNGNNESSTCGIAWNAAGDRAWATQMFEVLTDKINWTTRTVDGQIAVSAPAMGNSYHQATSDKVKGLLYVAAENGYLDVYDMNTNLPVGSINVRALTGSSTNAIHAIDLAPGNSGVAYVTSRWTPDRADNMELVINIADYNAPVLKGSINGLAESVCGVYAIGDKSAYYGTKPSLTLSKTGALWASYADYTAGLLTVNYSVGNSGTAGAANVSIVGSSSSMGVSVATAMPASLGNIAAGGSTSISLKYNVPGGTVKFGTTTYATAQNGAQVFTYPGPYSGA
ncbi:MAG: hypothetical protein ACYCXF_00810 [Thermoleophilia bacterium]